MFGVDCRPWSVDRKERAPVWPAAQNSLPAVVRLGRQRVADPKQRGTQEQKMKRVEF